MKEILIFLFILISFETMAQKKIEAAQVAQHIGDSVSLCTKVCGGRFLERTSITVLSLGKEFPNHFLIVVINGADREKFSFKPEVAFLGKTICVSGTVSEYGGKPRIIVTDPSQIKVN